MGDKVFGCTDAGIQEENVEEVSHHMLALLLCEKGERGRERVPPSDLEICLCLEIIGLVPHDCVTDGVLA